MASVEASPEEKAAFAANVCKNIAGWRDAPARSLHLKCMVGGELAGVVLVRDFWNLCNLFVAPQHQSRGLGRALLEAALAGCRGRSPRQVVRLNAARNAVGFYRRMGFVEVAQAAPGTGAVLFERALPD